MTANRGDEVEPVNRDPIWDICWEDCLRREEAQYPDEEEEGDGAWAKYLRQRARMMNGSPELEKVMFGHYVQFYNPN